MRHKAAVIIALFVLLLFLVSYFVPSWKMKNTENRTLATFGMVIHPNRNSVVYHESPVERLDAALSDQFAFRDPAVRQYLRLFNFSENRTYDLERLFQKQKEGQHALYADGDYMLIDDTDYITAFPVMNGMGEELKQKRTGQIEKIHSLFPDLKIYVYFVTQAFDTSWFDQYLGTLSANPYEDVLDALPDYVRSGHLVYQGMDDYKDIHYMTDHHWNHKGAQRGYEDIFWMMSRDIEMGDMRLPTAENDVSKIYGFDFLGRYARNLGSLYTGSLDDFCFYDYDLPDRELAVMDPKTREETAVVEMGLNEEYKAGELNPGADHYMRMYGSAKDADGTRYADSRYSFLIRSSAGNGKNLLIVGDSYARAIRDPLAAHFDTTVFLDKRILSRIPIDYVIEHYGIDVMLINSNADLWNSDQYFMTFTREA